MPAFFVSKYSLEINAAHENKLVDPHIASFYRFGELVLITDFYTHSGNHGNRHLAHNRDGQIHHHILKAISVEIGNIRLS